MAGFLSAKTKRKDFDEIYDDFSEFSLSSPARKIRRLDAELPPIMEDEELPGVLTAPAPAARAALPINEERALVLYKPMETPLLKSPSSPNLTITVNSDLIPGFKSYMSGDRSMLSPIENESGATNRNCLAVVPWVASQFPTAVSEFKEVGATELSVPMDAEEVESEGGLMEIDMDGEQGNEIGGGFGDAQQWNQQQHCMVPELPPNTGTPIMWSW